MINRTLTKRLQLPEVDFDLIRRYCSLDEDTSNDKVLQQYLVSAFDAAENRTNRFFTKSEVVVEEFDDTVKLPACVDTIAEVKYNDAIVTSYAMHLGSIAFEEVGKISVKYTTTECVYAGVLMFVLKYILHQLERNNPERGELDHSDLIPYMQ